MLAKSNLVFMTSPLPLLAHSEKGKEMTLGGEQDRSKRLLWLNFVLGLIFFLCFNLINIPYHTPK